MILAIDPGPTHSAVCRFENGLPISFGELPNNEISDYTKRYWDWKLVIEMIACYGMPVGREVFETCIWIGRFIEARGAAERITRGQVKDHICRSQKASDANVRQALIDMYGGKEKAIGKKKTPGPLYGMSGDCWAALALAVTASQTTERYQP